MNWTREWPTKPGMYWFHGRPFGYPKGRRGSPKTYLVEGWLGADGAVHLCIPGAFLYKAESGRGLWTEAVVPVPEEFV